jgi:hypothetical protein
MVHPNPMVVPLSKRSSIMGQITPPIDDPEMVMPIARERRFLNQVWTIDIVGRITRQNPNASRIPCTRIKCQYFVHKDHIMKLKTITTEPAQMKY